ncbi:MAG: hypothetical protein V3R85_08195 [Alphaproteobacteria bacterium]
MATSRNQAIKTRAFLILAGVLGVLFVALPTAILLSVGMMPTLVAMIVDMTRGRYLTKCVAGMNLAGVFPFLHSLVTTSHDMSTAINIVSDPFAWLVMYSAAAMGWLVFMGLPGVVSMFKVLTAKRRIYILQEQQRNLLNEWGDCILPNKDGNQDGDDGSVTTSSTVSVNST